MTEQSRRWWTPPRVIPDPATSISDVALGDGEMLLLLPVPPGGFVIPAWDAAEDVPGWDMTGAELDFHRRTPLYGSIFFTRQSDGYEVRVGVWWVSGTALLEAQCVKLDEDVKLAATEGIDTDALEASALRRVERVLELAFLIGVSVIDSDTQDTLMKAAGLGRLSVPPTWRVGAIPDGVW